MKTKIKKIELFISDTKQNEQTLEQLKAAGYTQEQIYQALAVGDIYECQKGHFKRL